MFKLWSVNSDTLVAYKNQAYSNLGFLYKLANTFLVFNSNTVYCSIIFANRIKNTVMMMIALTMEAVSTSETSANFYQTARRNIPEDSYLHTRRRENLKSHLHKCSTRR
jgi:hypothetical protein